MKQRSTNTMEGREREIEGRGGSSSVRASRPDLPDWMFEERKMPKYADVDPDKVELRR